MKKPLILALLALGVGLAGQAQALPTLQFNAAGPYTVTTGDTLSISLEVTGLGSEIVAAFDLDVLFDNSILSTDMVNIDSVTLMGGLSDTIFDVDVSVPGALNVWALSLLSDADIAALQDPMGGTFSLFTIDFTAIADGTTSLSLGPMSAAMGKDVKGYDNIPIIPSQVPEPGSLALLAIAGLAAAGMRRFGRWA